eukprot:gene15992-20435_t
MACPVGNLAQRPLPTSASQRDVIVGAEWVVDLKGPWTDAKGKICPSFSKCKYSLTCIDIASNIM